MDKTSIYIKMCEKAKEIQEIFQCRGLGENDFVNRDKSNPKRKGFCIIIWLPRQDQLQEMVFGHLNQKLPAWITIANFYNAINYTSKQEKSIEYYNQFTSMEQLWLAFVMCELYNKTWNGKTWVKI